MNYTKEELSIIKSLENGLNNLEKNNKIIYFEKDKLIYIQKAKIEFFKKGIRFRDENNKKQKKL